MLAARAGVIAAIDVKTRIAVAVVNFLFMSVIPFRTLLIRPRRMLFARRRVNSSLFVKTQVILRSCGCSFRQIRKVGAPAAGHASAVRSRPD